MSKRRSDKRKGGKKSSRHNPLAHVKQAFCVTTPTMSFSAKKERQMLRRAEVIRKRIEAAIAANNGAIPQEV